MTRLRPLSLAALAVLVMACAPAAASARVPNGFTGMVMGPPLAPTTISQRQLNQQLDRMVSSGVESLRFAVYWSFSQPYQSWSNVPAAERSRYQSDGVDQVPTRFAELDQLVRAAAQRGLTVLPTVMGAPAWDGRGGTPGNLARPRRNGPYGNFFKALIFRYGPKGTFWQQNPTLRRVPITMWQVWNEPNELSLWPRQPFEDTYVATLKVAYAAIHSADRHAKVVMPGWPNYAWQTMTAVYKAGARRYFDIAGVHPYTSQPQGVITIISRVRQVMKRYGDGRKPLFADEMGWPSSVGQTDHLYGFETTEAGQAANIGAVLPLLANARRQLGIQGFYYYTWAGVEHRNAYTFDFSGLLRYSGGRFVAKPALNAFARAALKIEGCRSKRSLATRCRS